MYPELRPDLRVGQQVKALADKEAPDLVELAPGLLPRRPRERDHGRRAGGGPDIRRGHAEVEAREPGLGLRMPVGRTAWEGVLSLGRMLGNRPPLPPGVGPRDVPFRYHPTSWYRRRSSSPAGPAATATAPAAVRGRYVFTPAQRSAGGRQGGLSRAVQLTPLERSIAAMRAAQARWASPRWATPAARRLVGEMLRRARAGPAGAIATGPDSSEAPAATRVARVDDAAGMRTVRQRERGAVPALALPDVQLGMAVRAARLRPARRGVGDAECRPDHSPPHSGRADECQAIGHDITASGTWCSRRGPWLGHQLCSHTRSTGSSRWQRCCRCW
jgi:hypothetical protein